MLTALSIVMSYDSWSVGSDCFCLMVHSVESLKTSCLDSLQTLVLVGFRGEEPAPVLLNVLDFSNVRHRGCCSTFRWPNESMKLIQLKVACPLIMSFLIVLQCPNFFTFLLKLGKKFQNTWFHGKLTETLQKVCPVHPSYVINNWIFFIWSHMLTLIAVFIINFFIWFTYLTDNSHDYL